MAQHDQKVPPRSAPASGAPQPPPSRIRHDTRREEGEETEHGAEIRAREPEEGQPPDELGLEETRPL